MATSQSSIPRAGARDESKPPPLRSVGPPSQRGKSAASALAPLVRSLIGGELPVRFELWDGSGFGPTDGPGTIHVRSVDALRRILWAPGELGFGRAYVAGDVELEGDLVAMFTSLHAVAPAGLAGRVARRAGGPECRLPSPGHRAPPARPSRRGAPRGTASFSTAGRSVGHAPLRRGQRVLRARPRSVDDLLVCPLRGPGHEPRAGSAVQARADLLASSACTTRRTSVFWTSVADGGRWRSTPRPAAVPASWASP